MLKDKLVWLLGLLMASQLSLLSLAVVECAVFAEKYPEKTRPQCLKIDETLQTAVNGYIALILALMVPTRKDAP